MSIPLSYVLPVYNADAWLQRKVEELLDDLAQQEDRFELLIIDDGSIDETAQVARMLARTYPQISFVRRQLRFGANAALQLAVRQAKGQRVVVVVHASNDLAIDQFRRIELVGKMTYPPMGAPHFHSDTSATRDIPKS